MRWVADYERAWREGDVSGASAAYARVTGRMKALQAVESAN